VYGANLSNGASAAQSADAFRRNHAAVFGVEPNDLAPAKYGVTGTNALPLMYDGRTGSYKFTLVRYAQYKDGLPVYRGDLRLLVRNDENFPLVLAASAVRDLGEFRVGAAHRGIDSTSSAAREGFGKACVAAGTVVRGLDHFTSPEVMVWAGLDDMNVAPATALVFTGDNGGSGGIVDDRWLFVADIETGEILHHQSMLIDVDVAGQVRGLATEGSAAEHCEDEVEMAMPYARVSIGGTNAFADEFGDFLIPNPDSSMVSVESQIRGRWFRVLDYVGDEEVLVESVLPPGPADFLHNPANEESTRAQVNAYVYANAVRDRVLHFHPTYPTLSTTEFPITVNRTDGYCPCNAWYDQFEVSLNFCKTGSSCPNTAWTSVIYHEYGHHLVEAVGSGQDQYGEGIGDSISIMMLDESGLGFGFHGPCDEPLREADNDMQYPCFGGSHDCAGLLSGCVWHTREALAASDPDGYAEVLGRLLVNSIPLHSGSQITPQITIDFMTLDDDDGDIANGTPHYDEIQAGFSAHGMPGPVLAKIKFVYPDGLPESVMPEKPAVIRVDVEPLAGEPVAGTGTVSYRVGGGAFTTVPMEEINPNQYEATLPATECPQTIEYYFRAQAVGGTSVTSPSDAPASVYATVAAVDSAIVADYTFELEPGWTVSGDADDGHWNVGVPVDCDRGDPPADFDGSGRCWLTDNSVSSFCNSDVDEGSTILTSEVFDLSGLDEANVTYARWYSNTQGASPGSDVFVVEVSDDGGSSWLQLERVGPTGAEADGGWYVMTFRIADFVAPNDQFRIRFVASDLGEGSVVEAGVDAFKIFAYDCESQAACAQADVNQDGVCDGFDVAIVRNTSNWLLATDEAVEPRCDINSDGIIDGFDIAVIRRTDCWLK
jgi:hypothetical protein